MCPLYSDEAEDDEVGGPKKTPDPILRGRARGGPEEGPKGGHIWDWMDNVIKGNLSGTAGARASISPIALANKPFLISPLINCSGDFFQNQNTPATVVARTGRTGPGTSSDWNFHQQEYSSASRLLSERNSRRSEKPSSTEPTKTSTEHRGSTLQKLQKVVELSRPIGLDTPAHPFQPGDWVYVKWWNSDPLRAKWRGPYQVLLTSLTSVKVAGREPWFHYSRVKRASAPGTTNQTEPDTDDEDVE
ncbi:uncharacterized protein LOC135414112 [Pseudopipra pipra]|uniref:uncharacterized protein LOC135414112 n=1 Tax=Pseudopipra pipra TaxID=415032 RepID=UPI003138BEB4